MSMQHGWKDAGGGPQK